MKKHHLLLAYIVLAIASFNTFAMEDPSAGKNGLRGKLGKLFSRKHEDPKPNRVSPALGAHLQKIQEGLDQKKQEAAFYSETFPGSEKLNAVKIEERGPMGVPHVLTDHAVSVCTIQDQAFLAYIAKEGGVHVVQSRDLTHWTKPTNIFGEAVQGATYVNCFTFQDHPYVTCGGKMTFSKDGKVWAEPYPLEHSENSLFVTMLQNEKILVAAHTGRDHCVSLSTSEDAVKWKPLKTVRNWQTQLPVSLGFLHRSLQIGWVSNTGAVLSDVVVSNLDDPQWSQWEKRTSGMETPGKTQHPISLSKYGNNLWMTYVDESRNIYTTAQDGLNWFGTDLLKKIKTDHPVAMFVHILNEPYYRDRAFLAYTELSGQVYIKAPQNN